MSQPDLTTETKLALCELAFDMLIEAAKLMARKPHDARAVMEFLRDSPAFKRCKGDEE